MGPALSVKNLREIRGIGPSVEEKLKAYFKSENNALTALRESRIAEISSIDGIGERFALSICRNLHYQETGEQIQNFLKTEDAILVYNRAIDIISKRQTRTDLPLLYHFLSIDLDPSVKAHRLVRSATNFPSLFLLSLYYQYLYFINGFIKYL